MPVFVRAADIQDIPRGRGKLVRVRGREIALFNADGAFYAVKSDCPHAGVSLHGGSVKDAIVTCPGHAWKFDLQSGDAVRHPDVGIRCYRVEIRGTSVWIEVP